MPRVVNPTRPAAVALTAVAIAFLTVFIVLPFAAVFHTALRDGWATLTRALARRETVQGVWLTVAVTFASVPVTVVFGVFAAWALGKFRFPGRGVLITLIDLPFSVSPIVVGIMFLTLFGRFGLLGGWLEARGLQIIFNWPGIVLTNLFIIMPFVARELLPTIEELGNEEEEAAVTLGASGFHTFFRVTLPNIKWALMYGIILATARSAGEFGAASVVSGLRRGRTVTLPIQIEIYYNEYMTVAAFASATLFSVFAVLTLVTKALVGRRVNRDPRLKEPVRERETGRAQGDLP